MSFLLKIKYMSEIKQNSFWVRCIYVYKVQKTKYLLVAMLVSVIVKRHHDQGKSCKGKHWIGAGFQFRSLVHCHNGRKHGRTQADIAAREGSGNSTSWSIGRVVEGEGEERERREKETAEHWTALNFWSPKPPVTHQL
jgi:hypothetical protein